MSAPGVVLLTESVVVAEAAREAEGSTTSPAVRSPADERVGGAVVEPVVEWVADDEWPVEVVSAVLSECEKTCLICERETESGDSSEVRRSANCARSAKGELSSSVVRTLSIVIVRWGVGTPSSKYLCEGEREREKLSKRFRFKRVES